MPSSSSSSPTADAATSRRSSTTGGWRHTGSSVRRGAHPDRRGRPARQVRRPARPRPHPPERDGPRRGGDPAQYGVSQMPVVGPSRRSPPARSRVGLRTGLLDALFTGARRWPTRSRSTWSPACRSSAPVSRSRWPGRAAELRRAARHRDGLPCGVLTRADLLRYLALDARPRWGLVDHVYYPVIGLMKSVFAARRACASRSPGRSTCRGSGAVLAVNHTGYFGLCICR